MDDCKPVFTVLSRILLLYYVPITSLAGIVKFGLWHLEPIEPTNQINNLTSLLNSFISNGRKVYILNNSIAIDCADSIEASDAIVAVVDEKVAVGVSIQEIGVSIQEIVVSIQEIGVSGEAVVQEGIGVGVESIDSIDDSISTGGVLLVLGSKGKSVGVGFLGLSTRPCNLLNCVRNLPRD